MYRFIAETAVNEWVNKSWIGEMEYEQARNTRADTQRIIIILAKSKSFSYQRFCAHLNCIFAKVFWHQIWSQFHQNCCCCWLLSLSHFFIIQCDFSVRVDLPSLPDAFWFIHTRAFICALSVCAVFQFIQRKKSSSRSFCLHFQMKKEKNTLCLN